jgi:hypothetical protein
MRSMYPVMSQFCNPLGLLRTEVDRYQKNRRWVGMRVFIGPHQTRTAMPRGQHETDGNYRSEYGCTALPLGGNHAVSLGASDVQFLRAARIRVKSF